MQELSAVSLGQIAAQTLADAKAGPVGQVVSVFPRSLYIRTTSDELIFVTCHQVRSPISLNVDSRVDLAQLIRPGESVGLREGDIRFGESASISLAQALPFLAQTTPRGDQLGVTRQALCIGAMILMILDNKQSLLDSTGLAHRAASEFVADGLLQFRRSKDVQVLRTSALRIIGLGQGFTPSGDDLIGGFLASYNQFASLTDSQPINLGLDVLDGKTTWISAKLLDYMQRHILDEQVSTLLDSSALRDSDFILALETLLPRGHTSGIDILVGVLLALSVINDTARNDDSTIAVAKSLHLLA